jgi:hypothetical protein
MGREAIARAEVDGHAAEVKALLEARELILRGPIRRRYAKAALQAVRAEGGALRFESGGEAVALHLGEPAAARWAEAIRKPLPSLRDKLDLGGSVLMIGACDDPALAEALADACTEDAAQARMIVARVDGAADLDRALAVPGRLAIWAVYAKGKSAFGDSAIRERLRAAGYRDTKACAVSDRLTATRYHPAG